MTAHAHMPQVRGNVPKLTWMQAGTSPGAHSWQDETSSEEENVPGAQLLHADAFAAFSSALYVPALHLEHAVDPNLSANVPAGHGSHMRLLKAPTSAENLPGSHAMHPSEVPGELAYVPGTQGMHTVLFGAGDSPSQHFEHAVAPADATTCPGGHALHVVAADTSEYAPALQLVHAELPSLEKYPLLHARHVALLEASVMLE